MESVDPTDPLILLPPPSRTHFHQDGSKEGSHRWVDWWFGGCCSEKSSVCCSLSACSLPGEFFLSLTSPTFLASCKRGRQMIDLLLVERRMCIRYRIARILPFSLAPSRLDHDSLPLVVVFTRTQSFCALLCTYCICVFKFFWCME